MTEIDIASEMKDQGVMYVKRFSTRKNNESVPTNTYLFSFSAPNPPKSIRAGYYSVTVDAYIPNPLRCFKCQKFGYGVKTCTLSVTCAHCAETTHVTEDCESSSKKCANCNGNHSAFSKDCPTWKKQMEINRIKYTNNVSFAEAKKLIQSRDTDETYASIARKPSEMTNKENTSQVITLSHACQTDLTWINTDIPKNLSPEQSTQTADLLPDQQNFSQHQSPVSQLGSQPGKNEKHTGKTKIKSRSNTSRPNRAPKGSDKIKLFHKFGSLEDTDVSDNIHPRAHSLSPSKKVRDRSPINPP
ncbi:uncharacterized protein [Haliotis asinina]|uniref:uncharacterized protein n=1 Tax=Haliotis asinina TaxID=109174 RepID=UPI003531DC29